MSTCPMFVALLPAWSVKLTLMIDSVNCENFSADLSFLTSSLSPPLVGSIMYILIVGCVIVVLLRS